MIAHPTRITETTSSILDHILCNQSNKVSQNGTLSINLSDHFPVYCTRKTTKEKISKHNTVLVRCMKNYTVEDFINKLNTCDWNSMFTADTVQESWLFFKDFF